MLSFPSNIEYYNPNMMAFSPSEAEDDASHEEDTPSPSPKRTTQRKPLPFVPINLEHFQPPAADSETASFSEPKQETKRRKANGSSKPVPIHATEGQDATAAATKTSTNNKGSSRRLREVQVFSQSGEMMYAFPNCAEAARKMDITRSRINRGKRNRF
jgi:hypothetical protein